MRIFPGLFALFALMATSALADCKPRFTMVDKIAFHPVPATSENMATFYAWQSWETQVQKKHGKIFAQWANAKKKKKRCEITSTTEVVEGAGFSRWRCTVSAHPCAK